MVEEWSEAVPRPPVATNERHILVLDLSKSMLAPLPDPGGVAGPPQKIEVARTAVYRILENASATGAQFGLVTFTEVARVAVPLTEMRREALPPIEGLISMLQPSGRSAIWDALGLGADLLRGMDGGVRGTIVLVTDGWDNASRRFTVFHPDVPVPTPGPKINVTEYLLPPNSEVTLRIIGIGSGMERDKGVDAARMQTFLGELERRAQAMGLVGSFTFQEVVTSGQLYDQMVNAFLDVGFEGAVPVHELHPEELARQAANAARALKDPAQHATVGRLQQTAPIGNGVAAAPSLEVDVLETPGGAAPAPVRDRYGPLGAVIESYLSRDYDRALDRLQRAKVVLPEVTTLYWEARIQHARGEVIEAARVLLQAWAASERLPEDARPRIVRRLALLQARMQNDTETESLVRFMEETEKRLGASDPSFRGQVIQLFERLMDLRGTYQLTRLESAAPTADAAVRHEAAIESAFGLLQDTRLGYTGKDPAVESALDFLEVCLAEMR